MVRLTYKEWRGIFITLATGIFTISFVGQIEIDPSREVTVPLVLGTIIFYFVTFYLVAVISEFTWRKSTSFLTWIFGSAYAISRKWYYRSYLSTWLDDLDR
jgi:hypothetical protein